MAQKKPREYTPYLTPELEAALTWPVTISNFIEVTGLKPSAARMRLKKMEENHEVLRLKPGVYQLPKKVKKSSRQGKDGYPLLTSLDQTRQVFDTLPWPMNTKTFHQYTNVTPNLSNSWLARLDDEGHLQRLRRGVYGLPSQEDNLKAAPHKLVSAPPRFSLDNLSKVFTTTQFGLEHGLDTKAISRYVQRLVQQGHLYRVGYRLLSQEPPLNLTFTAEEFANFFDLTPRAAGEVLDGHVADGDVSAGEGGTYHMTEAQREALIRAYFSLGPVEELSGKNLERAIELPEHDWPMREQDYARILGVSLPTAHITMQKFCTMGLLAKLPQRQGRAHLYDIASTMKSRMVQLLEGDPLKAKAQRALKDRP